METSELCKKCVGYCCQLYKNLKPEKVNSIRMKILGDLNKYSKKPIENNGIWCEFHDTNGCILNWNERPGVCLKFECYQLKEFKKGNKDISPPHIS